MSVELLEFQKEAQLFVLKNRASILSLATGLGKTITSISAVERVINRYPAAKCIYVTGDSILPQSVEDIRAHFDLKVIQIYKLTPRERVRAYIDFAENGGQILVLNYHILIRDIERICGMIVQENLQVVSIFDEANNIRTSTSKFHLAAKQLAQISYKTIALTATPSKQKIDDIYYTLQAIGIRLCSRDLFAKSFEIYSEIPTLQVFHKGKMLTQVQARPSKNRNFLVFNFSLNLPQGFSLQRPAKGTFKYKPDGKFQYSNFTKGVSKQVMLINNEPYELHTFAAYNRLGFKNTRMFMKKVSPFMYVKSKRSVAAQLPRYTLFKRYVEEDPKSFSVAANLYKGVYSKSESERVVIGNYAQLLIAQNTPQVYDDSIAENYLTNKFKDVLDIIENNVDMDDKIVIYSPWRKSIDILYSILLAEVYQGDSARIAKISGGEDTDNNTERIRFQTDSDCQCLLMTDAGTQGLNLQVANHIVFLNMPKDAGDYDQVGGRLPRVGSKHSALNAYFIIAKDTIDEDHYEMIMHNYLFMRSLHKEFGDETLQDTSLPPLDLETNDEFLIQRLGNRKSKYLKN